ncbi:MAG: hypothetical protein WAN10_18840 [Candidatus Acidiferrales bacterium]
MKTWTWRIVLAVVNVILSIGMSPWFFGGLLAHSVNLHFFVNCINVVPTFVSAMTATYQIDHHLLYWTHGYWVRYLFWEHQLLVFLFWWWAGWKIDLKMASRDCGRAWTIAEVAVALGLSLLLPLHRPYERGYPYVVAFRFVTLAWAVALFAYSLSGFLRLWGAQQRRG